MDLKLAVKIRISVILHFVVWTCVCAAFRVGRSNRVAYIFFRVFAGLFNLSNDMLQDFGLIFRRRQEFVAATVKEIAIQTILHILMEE
jgi:hypothetical protein